MDTQTFPRRAVTITVAATPPLPLTETLRCTSESPSRTCTPVLSKALSRCASLVMSLPLQFRNRLDFHTNEGVDQHDHIVLIVVAHTRLPRCGLLTSARGQGDIEVASRNRFSPGAGRDATDE